MKKLFLTFAMLGLALASQAQLTVSQPAAPEANRGGLKLHQPAERDAMNRPDKRTRRHHRDGPDALVWVDVNGKTVGRFASETSMVVPFKGQLAQILGLEAAALACPGECGNYLGPARWSQARWSPGQSLWYTSSDCSGQAYMGSRVAATPYVGTPIVEEDTTYIYFSRMADIGPVVWKSRFERNQCRASEVLQGATATLIPVVGVIPASALGTEPFTAR
jgi:hypothetical protein